MTAIQGEYLTIHRRVYVHLNPKPSEGPYTWNLSNKAGSDSNIDGISVIYTTLPIDSVTTSEGVTNIYFNIEGLDSVSDEASFLTGPSAVERLLDLPSPQIQTSAGLSSITAVSPVFSDSFNGTAVISFDIRGLTSVEASNRTFQIQTNDYNSDSNIQLTADKPLFSIGGSDSVITFDISSLDQV